MENFRKVIFNLNEQGLSLGDMGFNDPKDIAEERHATFIVGAMEYCMMQI